jgi:hypothetical protein
MTESMATCADQGLWCTACNLYNTDCGLKCNEYLDGKPRKKREEVKEDE